MLQEEDNIHKRGNGRKVLCLKRHVALLTADLTAEPILMSPHGDSFAQMYRSAQLFRMKLSFFYVVV